MKVVFTEPFQDRYKKLPKSLQARFEKQLKFLLKNLRHPSLRAKKYDEARDIWQARVNGHYRFYFQIRSDTYYILTVVEHGD